MRRRQLFGALALLLMLLVLWAMIRSPRNQTQMEEGLVITALPVGKADALILQEADHVIVVDTGEKNDGPFLLEELRKRGVSQVDLLLITHFDKDHVGAASYLLDHMEAVSVIMPDYEGDREEYREFLDRLTEHSDTKRITELQQFSMGELQIVVYPAEDPAEIQDTDKEYDNDMSLVVSVTYGSRRFLFTGDIEKTRIAQMLATDTDWKHDWIKMPHHGRYQKALKELLNKVKPDIAVICCSDEEYAEKKTLELLENRNVEVWDTSGQTIVTVCDGEQIEVRTE